MNCPTKVIVTFFVACCFFVSSANLFAQSMHGLQQLEDAIPNSIPYEGQALWFSRYVVSTGATQRMSAVRINQCWGITAGHAVEAFNVLMTDFVVGNGPNWLTEPGATREVAEYITHPTWDGYWNGSKVDLALIRWTQPLPGPNLTIGALTTGEVFEYAGYARPALPGHPQFPHDGERRAWQAKVHGWGNLAGTVSSKYARSTFWHSELPHGGIVTPGGSGSGGYNAAGELVALLVYGMGSPNYLGDSYGLRLNLPEVKDWIESHISDLSCVPPPKPRPKITSVFAIRAHLVADCLLGHSC